LSYTSFELDGLSPASQQVAPGDPLTLQVRVTNTGDRAGAEVVQAYVSYPAELGEPPQQLRAFRKVALQPGESEVVELALGSRALAVWDTTSHAWVVHPGSYGIQVGNSSEETPLAATVTVP